MPHSLAPLSSRRAFLKSASSAACAGSLSTLLGSAYAAEKNKPLLAYVGTYSSPLPIIRPGQVDLPPGNGKGIHIFEVDRNTGVLTPSSIYEMPTSPSAVVASADGAFLYSANETEKLAENEAGSISAFSVDRATGRLTLLNTVSSGGAGPTHMSLHPTGKFLFVANYFGGSVAVLPVLADGKLGKLSDFKQDEGTAGPKKATNAPPGSFAISGHDQVHAHMIEPAASGKFVISTDLGLDQIMQWKFDDSTGKLTANQPAHISLPPGDGPRHFAFHPNGNWFYCLQEEGSTVTLFDYDASRGTLTARQTLSSLPPGFGGSNFCSEIRVSADGRFVYAANRLHDSIAYFSVAENGTLTFVSEEWTRGDYPRSFSFDPTGNFLYCCNQRGDAIALFRVDKKTGALTFTGHITPVGNPSSIIFVDLAKAG